MFFDGGTFWVLPLTYFNLPKSARAYPFPRSVNNIYFCCGPVSVDPVCPQPRYGLLGLFSRYLTFLVAAIITTITIIIIIIIIIITSSARLL